MPRSYFVAEIDGLAELSVLDFEGQDLRSPPWYSAVRIEVSL